MTEGVMDKVRLGRTDLDGHVHLLRHLGARRHAGHLWLRRRRKSAPGLPSAPFSTAPPISSTLRAIYGIGPQRGADRRRHSRARRPPAGFVLSTKLDRDPETNVFDAARARRSLEQSLKALGLEQIDLLHLHDPEHARSLERRPPRRRARRTLPHQGRGPREGGRARGRTGLT